MLRLPTRARINSERRNLLTMTILEQSIKHTIAKRRAIVEFYLEHQTDDQWNNLINTALIEKYGRCAACHEPLYAIVTGGNAHGHTENGVDVTKAT